MLTEVYSDCEVHGTVPTDKINHVGNGFDVSRIEISALKISLALDSQKNSKTKNYSKIRIKRKRRIIGDNSTSRFCTIESHGNDSKTRKLGVL